jgi:hypothetical protein
LSRGRRVTRNDLKSWFSRVRPRTRTQRVSLASSLFLGTRYIYDPVGEGRRGDFDRRPIFRMDGFDCQTYVETVIALTHSSSVDGFRRIVRSLRYREGRVSFDTRNHFVATQWVKNNVAGGLLSDITAEVARGTARRQRIQESFNLTNWYRALSADRLRGFSDQPTTLKRVRLRNLRRLGGTRKQATASHAWLSFSAVARADRPFPEQARLRNLYVNSVALARIPHGSVVVIQYGERVHMGIVLRNRGRLLLRHANRLRGAVVEHDLLTLFMTLKKFGPVGRFLVLRPLAAALAGLC